MNDVKSSAPVPDRDPSGGSATKFGSPLQQVVAHSADLGDLHATAPALLLELFTRVGALSAIATGVTERGRRPFRPPAEWAVSLGDLAYGVYLLADQTGVDIEQQVKATASAVRQRAQRQVEQAGWPFDATGE